MKIKKILSSLGLLLIPISMVSCFQFQTNKSELKKEDLTKNNEPRDNEYQQFLSELSPSLDSYQLSNNIISNTYWPANIVEPKKQSIHNFTWNILASAVHKEHTISDKFDFNKYIVQPIQKKIDISEKSLIRLFELLFLNGEKLEDVLKKNSLYLYSVLSETPKYKNALLYTVENNNIFYIYNISKWSIMDHFNISSIAPDNVVNDPYHWTVLKVPKNKQVKIKRINQFEKIQEIKDELASKYNNSDNQLFYNFLTQKNEKIFDFFLKNQTKNKIIAKSPWFLNKLASSSLISYDKPFLENYTTQITNPSDFQSFVNKVINLDSSQTSRQISFNFRKSFLNGQTLDKVLKNNNIFILETWKPMYFSDWLLVRKQDNNNIYLTTAKTSDFEFEEQLQDHFSFDKVGFQVIVVPKTQKITFNYKTNFKELNQDFIKQESEN